MQNLCGSIIIPDEDAHPFSPLPIITRLPNKQTKDGRFIRGCIKIFTVSVCFEKRKTPHKAQQTPETHKRRLWDAPQSNAFQTSVGEEYDFSLWSLLCSWSTIWVRNHKRYAGYHSDATMHNLACCSDKATKKSVHTKTGLSRNIGIHWVIMKSFYWWFLNLWTINENIKQMTLRSMNIYALVHQWAYQQLIDKGGNTCSTRKCKRPAMSEIHKQEKRKQLK